jgi:uncharacterized protein (DUF934 family)
MLVKAGHIGDDIFVNAGMDTPLPDGPAIVPLPRFLDETEVLLARASPLGVALATGDDPQILTPFLERLALITLTFGHFKDGRVFSQARLLRSRLGYTGEIRVRGHFLRDQIAFLARAGVDAFELPPLLAPADVEAARREIRHVYQRSVDGRRTIGELRRDSSRS